MLCLSMCCFHRLPTPASHSLSFFGPLLPILALEVTPWPHAIRLGKPKPPQPTRRDDQNAWLDSLNGMLER